MPRKLILRWAFVLILVAAACSAVPSQAAENGKNGGVLVSGKVFCNLKLPVLIPFTCQVDSVVAYSGMPVKKGDVLGRYTLDPLAALALRRSVKDSQLAKMESRIARLENSIRLLEKKRRDIKQLVDENLAPSAGLKDVQTELAVLYKERSAYVGELNEERELFRKNLDILEEDLGQPVSSGNIPEEANLVAPMDGHVVWVGKHFRPGSKLNKGATVVSIGVMNPMILLAQVHEIEAQKLKVGDRATFTPESMPDRSFECRVTRISWAPVDVQIDQPSYYQVEFNLPNPDLVLKEGQKGNIRFNEEP